MNGLFETLFIIYVAGVAWHLATGKDTFEGLTWPVAAGKWVKDYVQKNRN